MNPYIIPGLKNVKITMKYFSKLINVPVEVVIKETCDVYKIDTSEIVRRTRKKDVCSARHTICWVLVKKFGMSRSAVAKKVLGGRDHTTIINSLHKFDNLYETEDTFKDKADLILDNLTAWRKEK